jgi:hypothetical protein
LIHAYAPTIRQAGWPLVPHLFVLALERRHASVESGMYDIVAKAFGRNTNTKLQVPYNYLRPQGAWHNPNMSRAYDKGHQERVLKHKSKVA